jgi:hypothetical protein
VAEFTSEDLTGSRFEDVYLTDARFHDVDLTNARFHLVDLTGATIRGAALVNVDISGEVDNLRVNGVDVVPLVEAELDRRYPDRVNMRPTDADGFREAWDILERLWQRTVGRARGMTPEVLHERVEGEWSFIETLRHLVFATDAWVKRAILGEPSPWHPLDLPHDEMPDEPSVPRDRDARPSLDEVLALRADRVATISPTRNWPARPNESGSRVTRSRRPSPYGAACRPSSTKSGSTGCTPNGTSTCSSPGRPDGRVSPSCPGGGGGGRAILHEVTCRSEGV